MGFISLKFNSGIISLWAILIFLPAVGSKEEITGMVEEKAINNILVTLKYPFQPKAGLPREGEMGMKKMFTCEATGGI